MTTSPFHDPLPLPPGLPGVTIERARPHASSYSHRRRAVRPPLPVGLPWDWERDHAALHAVNGRPAREALDAVGAWMAEASREDLDAITVLEYDRLRGLAARRAAHLTPALLAWIAEVPDCIPMLVEHPAPTAEAVGYVYAWFLARLGHPSTRRLRFSRWELNDRFYVPTDVAVHIRRLTRDIQRRGLQAPNGIGPALIDLAHHARPTLAFAGVWTGAARIACTLGTEALPTLEGLFRLLLDPGKESYAYLATGFLRQHPDADVSLYRLLAPVRNPAVREVIAGSPVASQDPAIWATVFATNGAPGTMRTLCRAMPSAAWQTYFPQFLARYPHAALEALHAGEVPPGASLAPSLLEPLLTHRAARWREAGIVALGTLGIAAPVAAPAARRATR